MLTYTDLMSEEDILVMNIFITNISNTGINNRQIKDNK